MQNKLKNTFKLHTFFLAIAMGFIAASCQMSFEGFEAEESISLELKAQTQAIESAQKYWETAANSDSPLKEELQLEAIKILIESKNIELSRNYIDQVIRNNLSNNQNIKIDLLLSRLLTLEGYPKKALDVLPSYNFSFEINLQKNILLTRAKVLKANRQNLMSIKAQLQLGRVMAQEEKHTAYELLWENIQLEDERQLKKWLYSVKDSELKAWLEFAYLSKSTVFPASSIKELLLEWKEKNESHYASKNLYEKVYQELDNLMYQPRKIAILLPMTGSNAKFAKAIFSGIEVAHKESSSKNKPSLQIYDTGEDSINIEETYTLAIQEGADFIVGPLDKKRVETLVKNLENKIGMLTLNYADEYLIAPQHLYQFGLLPEDEARVVAEKAALDGKKSAIVITPDTDWGKRFFNTFKIRFNELEGKVAAYGQYSTEKKNYSEIIKKVLKIEESEERIKSLKNILSLKLIARPKRRQDIDMVFFAAFPEEARQLKPQLDYFYAKNLPTYATSSIYSGTPDAAKDKDLNGVLFCDMPWTLDATEYLDQTEVMSELRNPEQPHAYPRLVALGIDTYKLIPYLNRLQIKKRQRLYGFTGKLSVDEFQRVHRELYWARFSKGRPRLLN